VAIVVNVFEMRSFDMDLAGRQLCALFRWELLIISLAKTGTSALL